jgi:hypothetical protein
VGRGFVAFLFLGEKGRILSVNLLAIAVRYEPFFAPAQIELAGAKT